MALVWYKTLNLAILHQAMIKSPKCDQEGKISSAVTMLFSCGNAHSMDYDHGWLGVGIQATWKNTIIGYFTQIRDSS